MNIKTEKLNTLLCITIHNLTTHSFMKTVAIYGEKDKGYYNVKAVTAVGPDSTEGRHAENLLLANISKDIVHDHSFICLSRLPCYDCMKLILRYNWKKLSLYLPKNINVMSKWRLSQMEALDYMEIYYRDKDTIEVIYYD